MSWLSEAAHWLADHPAIAGGLISGGSILLAAGVVTWRLNRGMKRAEFVLGFTKQYHDILAEKHKFNQNYIRTRSAGPPPRLDAELQENDARELYRRLFGLMFDEFFAYQRGLLDQEIFAEWMKWRIDDFSGRAT